MSFAKVGKFSLRVQKHLIFLCSSKNSYDQNCFSTFTKRFWQPWPNIFVKSPKLFRPLSKVSGTKNVFSKKKTKLFSTFKMKLWLVWRNSFAKNPTILRPNSEKISTQFFLSKSFFLKVLHVPGGFDSHAKKNLCRKSRKASPSLKSFLKKLSGAKCLCSRWYFWQVKCSFHNSVWKRLTKLPRLFAQFPKNHSVLKTWIQNFSIQKIPPDEKNVILTTVPQELLLRSKNSFTYCPKIFWNLFIFWKKTILLQLIFRTYRIVLTDLPKIFCRSAKNFGSNWEKTLSNSIQSKIFFPSDGSFLPFPEVSLRYFSQEKPFPRNVLLDM